MKSLLRNFLFIMLYIITISCENNTSSSSNLSINKAKEYEIDEFGNIISTEFLSSQFESAKNCKSCHMTHYEEWSESMHAYSMHDPIFFSKKESAEHSYPQTGERFCIQCHNPVAYLTGEDLSDYSSVEDIMNSGLPESILEGISCDVCHSMVDLSPSVHAGIDIAANAKYYMNPDNDIKYGSIKNPSYNNYHQSEYNPIFVRSELCLPCHDLKVRDVEAQITFTEWNRIPGLAMSGALSCQECHMSRKSDGSHDHRFVGVDVDLNYPIGESPLHSAVQNMLEGAIELKIGYLDKVLPDTIISGDTLEVPITISSRTAHSFPSGTSSSREAWLEILILHELYDTLFQSGFLETNIESLDKTDPFLLLFTSYILDENGHVTNSVTKTYDIINNTLLAFSDRYHSYKVKIPINISGEIQIKLKMRFRSFKPEILYSHPDCNDGECRLLDNLPIFDMASKQYKIDIISP